MKHWRSTPERYAWLETEYVVIVLGAGTIAHPSQADAALCARENRDYGYNVRTGMVTHRREGHRWVPCETEPREAV